MMDKYYHLSAKPTTRKTVGEHL